ncbi:hypothetical protein A3B46_02805 [Candidatus Roizmanbacteria bacterium RIFCSPLOWO2_01_FULL_39_19]|nr:MAG: hypothetical protein A3B46_02805 [Candidatus Roizmanbacteria bacterium RIFCSPLOWO2_01_FULL_39_19]
MKIFIDTGAFIAYFVKVDDNHADALEKYKVYRKNTDVLFTSNYIVDELLTWFSYHRPQNIVIKLISEFKKVEANNEIRIVHVDETIHKKAINTFIKFSEHKISFTDCTSYVLFKEFAFDEIFTFDHDFKKMKIQTSF